MREKKNLLNSLLSARQIVVRRKKIKARRVLGMWKTFACSLSHNKQSPIGLILISFHSFLFNSCGELVC